MMSNLGGRLSHLPLLHHLLSHHCWLWQRCRQHEAGKAFLRPCHVCWRCLFLDSHQLTRSNNPSALMHATIFGNVVSIVGRMYGRRAEYDKKVKLKVSVVPISCFRCSTWNTLPGFTNCQRMCARGWSPPPHILCVSYKEAEQLESRSRKSGKKIQEHFKLFTSFNNHPGWWITCRQSGFSIADWIARFVGQMIMFIFSSFRFLRSTRTTCRVRSSTISTGSFLICPFLTAFHSVAGTSTFCKIS